MKRKMLSLALALFVALVPVFTVGHVQAFKVNDLKVLKVGQLGAVTLPQQSLILQRTSIGPGNCIAIPPKVGHLRKTLQQAEMFQ